MEIALSSDLFNDEEIAAVQDVIASGHVTMGARCAAFEQAFAEYLNVGNAIFVNSGSSANLLALFALANRDVPASKGRKPIAPGAEVLVPAVTWSTTVSPVLQIGAIPVFVDTDPGTLQMRTADLEAALSEKTAAVIPTHIMGNAVNMDELLAFAEKHGLWVLEDTCEALGTRYDGKFAGTLGDIGSFSFYYSHHITTIEGGMVVTNDDALAELLRCLRAHGWTRDLHDKAAVESHHPDVDPRFMFVNTGFNLRPTEINGALGLIQLRKLEGFNESRRRIAGQWRDAFKQLTENGDLGLMQPTPGADVAPFAATAICRDPETRRALQAHLGEHGIDTRPIVCGNMARQPLFNHTPHRIVGELSGADRIMNNGLYWGLHPGMGDLEVHYVIENVLEFFRS